MPKYETFEDLPVWQEACRLYNRVLDLLEEPGLTLPAGFRTQLDRTALAISSNIVEGFGRSARADRLAFLVDAHGFDEQLRSMIALVKDRPKLKGLIPRLDEIRALADSCGKQLGGWIHSIQGSAAEGKRPATPQPGAEFHPATAATSRATRSAGPPPQQRT
jgi:four helix bundle protein